MAASRASQSILGWLSVGFTLDHRFHQREELSILTARCYQREEEVERSRGWGATLEARGYFAKHGTAVPPALPLNFAARTLSASSWTCKGFGSASALREPQP